MTYSYERLYFKKALEFVLTKGSCTLIELLSYLKSLGVNKLDGVSIANCLFENPLIWSDGETFCDEALRRGVV